MKKELIYEGNEKSVYNAIDNCVIIEYNDYLAAFNGLKKAKILNKGFLINQICSNIFECLNKNSIKTHFIKKLNKTEQLCYKLDILPLKFIRRNVATGTLVKRLNLEEGQILKSPIYEIMLRKDDTDILVNESHVVNLNLLTYEELKEIRIIQDKVNNVLNDIFRKGKIMIVDFKLEFGFDYLGNLLIGDEISPNTSRLWEENSNLCFDKDRFRKDQGEITEFYQELLKRMSI